MNMNQDSAKLTLYVPEYRDLWFRQRMLADEETMSYNHAWGGTVPFPEEDWQDWYDFWVVNPEDGRIYRFLKDASGEFVGEIAYHPDPELQACIADVIIYAPFRGRGYGSRALDLLCALAAENGLTCLYDDIAIDNPAADMFLRHGFREESRTEEKIILRIDLH
ncbi:MAG: GNAT family N-acetyltransferase [Lachnospiraceae bacterium]|nr:GNAT family N-acetyltransferase [Lachnospiraceae bacterium]